MPVVSEGRVPEDHPSLPGHFPGHPIVPGVLLLDAVIEAAGRHLGPASRVVGLPSAKFLAPLAPGVPFSIELEPVSARTLAFVVRAAESKVASGTLRCAAASEGE